MNNDSFAKSGTPFPSNYRAGGVLVHVTSLPSQYGIGDLGPAARAWVDQLHAADQTWWQVLPLGPTGIGNSPYSSLSSFAGNWLLISPDDLIADGLLPPDAVSESSFPDGMVDFPAVSRFKRALLDIVWQHFTARADSKWKGAFEEFRHVHGHWLDDYALFLALHDHYGTESYLEWPTELARREPSALARARGELADRIDRYSFAEFLVHRQGTHLKQYAHSKGIRLIGDLPFFVSANSCDVWAHPELFLLDEDLRPQFVAGVPPDYFSATGQLWGNPIYDWAAIRRTRFRWCLDRIRASLAHVDLVRLDHFRGFAAAWHVPADSPTALDGQWVPGPGLEFFRAAHDALGALPFIAEDLGLITPDVRALREAIGLPGMLVLQFAFDGSPDNPYLPEHHVPQAVVCTGTHDNNTTRGWFRELSDAQRQSVSHLLGDVALDEETVSHTFVRIAWSSPAALAIAPLQDLLNLDAGARMNIPGQREGNWTWRVTRGMLAASDLTWLRDLTTACGRRTQSGAAFLA